METKDTKKSIFETPLLSTKVKTADVKLFPETALGYLIGPAFALIANGVVNTYLSQYWVKILGIGYWCNIFTWLLPLVSTIIVVCGNLLVGRLIERKPGIAGKARPFILAAMPLMALALLLLFLVPFPDGELDALKEAPDVLVLVFIAIGYNLYYALAYPFYYTSHSALVNLSTRDRSKRSLLATASNAAQLVASGLAGMIFPFLIDLLHLLPSKDTPLESTGLASQAFRSEANSKWVILMIILIVIQVIGCLIEYFFTRERITEEKVKLRLANPDNAALEAKKIPMSKQASICVRDKYWWLIIIFYFLYQLGGMLKNNDASWFSQAFTGGTSISGLINIVGAIPTAVGMLVIWPLANKFGKANCIKVGGVIAFLMGCLGFTVLTNPGNETFVTGMAISAFCLKAIGTVPAMYISMALMSDVIEHEEAVYGIRTDGFTMSVYGSIMIGLPGVANAIINLVNTTPAIMNNEANNQIANTFLFFGGESVCYLIIALLFLFMGVEKFAKFDKPAITADQKAKAEKDGAEWIDPETRLEQEQAEAEEQVHQEQIANLRKHVEKNNAKVAKLEAEKKPLDGLVMLDFDKELQKFEADRAAKKAENLKKKEEADAKKAAMKKQKEDELANKIAAMSEAERDAYYAKQKAKEEKRQAALAATEAEFNALRDANAAEREANLA